MEKINFNTTNSKIKLITSNDKLIFSKGHIFQAEIINNTPTGVLIKVNNTILHAETSFKLPIGSQLFLTVVGQKKQQVILSLNNNVTLYNLEVSNIIRDLGLEDSSEIKLIINKLIKTKQQISKENIDNMKLLINKLPVEFGDSLNLITDPSLFLAIFSFLNKNSGFSLLINSKKAKYDQESDLEVNVLYQSQTLGDILINVIWQEKIKIMLTCSTEFSYQLLTSNLNILKQKINSFVQNGFEINAILDSKLTQNIKNQNDEQEPTILGIDIRI